jgi:hypothetical protein
MNRIVTSALAIACVAMSMPGMADDKYPAGEKEKPGISKPGDVSPPVAQAMVDDVLLGTAVATDGQIPAKSRTDDFVPGEDIYLTMDVSDAAPGTMVKVVWFGPDEQRIGEQRETVSSGVSTLKFKKDGTKTWKTGDYRAEIWVGDEKVNDERFNIVSARSASK